VTGAGATILFFPSMALYKSSVSLQWICLMNLFLYRPGWPTVKGSSQVTLLCLLIEQVVAECLWSSAEQLWLDAEAQLHFINVRSFRPINQCPASSHHRWLHDTVCLQAGHVGQWQWRTCESTDIFTCSLLVLSHCCSLSNAGTHWVWFFSHLYTEIWIVNTYIISLLKYPVLMDRRSLQSCICRLRNYLASLWRNYPASQAQANCATREHLRTFKITAVKFRNSFIPYCLDRYV